MQATPHDPFQPPRAQLEVLVERGPRPKQVKMAAILIVIAAILTFLSNVAFWVGLVAIPAIPQVSLGDYLSAILSLALMCFLAWKIHLGRNWARWIFTMLIVLGVLGLAVSFLFAMKVIPPSLWVVSSANTALDLIAVLLLFGREASSWFRPKG